MRRTPDEATTESPAPWTDRAAPWALAIVTIVLLLLTRPFADIPRNDDFSYARTAEALARTGHIVYNGWGTPLLWPQAALGAILIRLFGFSYPLLQGFGIASAGLAALLCYRLARVSGVTPGLACLLTAAATLNPVFLPVAPSFMTDAFSLALMYASLLALMRSLPRTESEATLDTKWFWLSVLLAAVAGANRQTNWIAYFGALIPVLFALPEERMRKVLPAAAIVLAVTFLLSSWFARQPYTVPADLSTGLQILIGYTEVAATSIVGILSLLGLLLLPCTVVALRRDDLRRPMVYVSAVVGVLLVLFPFSAHFAILKNGGGYGLSDSGQYFTARGVDVGYMHGLPSQPAILPGWLCLAFGILGGMSIGTAAYLSLALFRRRTANPDLDAPLLLRLRVLIAAMSVQIVGSLPLLSWHTSDRYALYWLPLLGIALLLRVRSANRAVVAVASAWAAGFALLAWGFAATYMNYSRAQATLYQQLRARNIPPQQIDGGFEPDADTQVVLGGHINNEAMLASGEYDPNSEGRYVYPLPKHFPALDAHYTLSLDIAPNLPFPVDPQPVASLNWNSIFPPQARTMYALRIDRPDVAAPSSPAP